MEHVGCAGESPEVQHAAIGEEVDAALSAEPVHDPVQQVSKLQVCLVPQPNGCLAEANVWEVR